MAVNSESAHAESAPADRDEETLAGRGRPPGFPGRPGPGRRERTGPPPGGGSRRGRRPGVPVWFGALATGLVLLLAVSSGLAAQQEGGEEEEQVSIDTPFDWIPRSLRVGLFGGYLATDRGTLDIGPGSSPLLGARARARLSGPISLEASAAYGSSDRRVIDPRLETGPAPVDEVDSDWLLIQVGAQFAFTGNRTWHGIHPYGIVGAGFMFGVNEETSPALMEAGLEDLRYQINTLPSVQAGLGAEYFLSERYGLAFEVRNHFLRIETPDGFFSQEILERIEELDVQAPQETDWTNNLELSVTLYRYF